MSRKPANSILAALYGAILAVVICFAISYLGVLTGWVNPTLVHPQRGPGTTALARSALNVYVMQHVTISGRGHDSGDPPPFTSFEDSVKLPLTIWFAIPALAVFIGGLVTGLLRRGSGVAGAVLPAILGGVIYALILTLVSRWAHASIDWTVIPAIGGVSFNPHEIDRLYPNTVSALAYTGLFGVLFSYLGGMMACRKERVGGQRGVWWGPVKAVFWVGLIFQLVLMSGFAWWLFNRAPRDLLGETRPGQLVPFAPTISGLAYAGINGLTLTGSLEPPAETQGAMRETVNVYFGMASAGLDKQPGTIPVIVKLIAAVVAAICAFLIGLLAFVWGPRDGAFRAAFRCTAVMALYLAVIDRLCRFGWGSWEEWVGKLRFLVHTQPGWIEAIAAIGFLIFALIGASIAGLFCKGRRAVGPAQ